MKGQARIYIYAQCGGRFLGDTPEAELLEEEARLWGKLTPETRALVFDELAYWIARDDGTGVYAAALARAIRDLIRASILYAS